MPRPDKVRAVAEIKERVEEANAVFLAEFAGLSVKEQQELRRGLREVGSEFKVVKMSLARLAASELGHEAVIEWLAGPTGLTFAETDAASTAKVLRDFAQDHAALVMKGGLLGSEVLLPEKITELADLEPREVILARIAGGFEAPMAKLARLLQALPRDMVSMLRQLADQKAESGDDSAEAAAEEEAATVAELDDDATPADGESGADAKGEGPDSAASDEPVAEAATDDDEPADEAEEE